ncbi:MAG: hypothetical protein HFI95_16220 [Lachnospiraceae bacterium]|nr:hypothetical protein [Lachnospiraceae bacterium]
MKRNNGSSLLWLLLIPGQFLADIFFVAIGIRLDFMIFSGGEGGHGIPVFSAIFFVIAAAVTIVVLILAVVLTIRGFLQK